MAKKKEEKQESTLSRTQEILKDINDNKKANFSPFIDMSGEINTKFKRISTGIFSLDVITGGGWPVGRICELFGGEGSGKSSTCLKSIAACQKKGGVCAFLDSEHALNLDYAAHLGVNVNDILFQQPSWGEESFEAVSELTKYLKEGDLIVVDSVAALTPRAMYEAGAEDKFMGTQAKMLSEGLGRVKSRINQCGAILLFTNQTRQKIGGMGYGPQETTPGGNALKFYCSIRVKVSSIGKIKKSEEVVGNKTKFETVKNKTYPPFRKAETELIFGEGIPWVRDLLLVGLDTRLPGSEGTLIKRAGAWYSYRGERLGAGVDNSLEKLYNDKEMLKSLEDDLGGYYGFEV